MPAASKAMLVDVDDIESLQAAMERMYIDHDQYDHLIISEETSSKFSGASIARKLVALYSEIVDGKAK